VQGSILVIGVPRATSQRLLILITWSPGKEVVHPEGLWCREGGTLPWVVQVEGNERLLVGIVAGVVNLQKYQVL
jgi:hypothetical protein